METAGKRWDREEREGEGKNYDIYGAPAVCPTQHQAFYILES